MDEKHGSKTEDRNALQSLSQALADAAAIHRSGSEVADSDALRARMADRAARLEALSTDVAPGPADAPPASSAIGLLDRLRLNVDRLFGDDDRAADTASREAMTHLARLIDGQLRNPELSPDVQAVLAAVRARIGGRPVEASSDLKALPG